MANDIERIIFGLQNPSMYIGLLFVLMVIGVGYLFWRWRRN